MNFASEKILLETKQKEPVIGFEPMTNGLQNRCSTTELNRHYER